MGPLVTPLWLAKRMREEQVFVLDATLAMPGVAPVQGAPSAAARYRAAHLPGAVFFDIDTLSDRESPLPHMLPTPERFGQAMEELGVSRDATLVVYEQGGVFFAPRARWMLRAMGAGEVFLLDGGLEAWRASGLALEAGTVQHPRGSFRGALEPGVVENLASVQGHLQTLAGARQVVDARSAARFRGLAPEPRPGIRSGHMPGSTNLPYTEVIGGGHMLPVPELQARFEDRCVDLAKPLITTCGSGVTAAVVALAAELCGAKHISLYDGSWAEYAQCPEATIENSYRP